MRFSICMVAKNAEKTIEKAIQSILKQSFYDYEIVIVDDGSQDSTISIVEKFKDDRIKIYAAQYSCLLKIRAQSIEMARGEYIITVDSDDALVDGALETIDELIKQTNVDILNYKGIKVFDNGKQVEFPNLLPDKTNIFEPKIREIFDSLVIRDDFTTLWNKAIKRSCIDVEQIKTCSNLSIGEDNIILLFTFPNVKSYFYIQKPLYLYTVSGGITKRFRRDSYSNQKRRMECKKIAIESAGFEYSEYDEKLKVMFIETVSKICAYYPTVIDSRDSSKQAFYACLKEIQEDDAFWKTYKLYKGKVGIIYKFPLWLVRNRMNFLTMRYKNLCAKLRK